MRVAINHSRFDPVPGGGSFVHSIAEDQMQYVRQGLDQAFQHGSWAWLRHAASVYDDLSMHCPRCWDDDKEAAGDPRCDLCYGNGFIDIDSGRGYSRAVRVRMMLGEVTDDPTPTVGGETNQNSNDFWIEYTERPIRTGDLLQRMMVDDYDHPLADHDRSDKYQIASSRWPVLHPGDPHLGATLSQHVTALTVQPDSNEWRVPIDWNFGIDEMMNEALIMNQGSELWAWLS